MKFEITPARPIGPVAAKLIARLEAEQLAKARENEGKEKEDGDAGHLGGPPNEFRLLAREANFGRCDAANADALTTALGTGPELASADEERARAAAEIARHHATSGQSSSFAGMGRFELAGVTGASPVSPEPRLNAGRECGCVPSTLERSCGSRGPAHGPAVGFHREPR